MAADEARALTFTTLVLASIGLIFTNRSWSRSALATLQSPNAALWWVTIGAMAILAAVLFIPALSGLFSFSRLHGVDVLLCVSLGFATFMIFEVLKLLRISRL
jgi:Ca2+-transporting ATPase